MDEKYLQQLYADLQNRYGSDKIIPYSDFSSKVKSDTSYQKQLYDDLSNAYGKDKVIGYDDFTQKVSEPKPQPTVPQHYEQQGFLIDQLVPKPKEQKVKGDIQSLAGVKPLSENMQDKSIQEEGENRKAARKELRKQAIVNTVKLKNKNLGIEVDEHSRTFKNDLNLTKKALQNGEIAVTYDKEGKPATTRLQKFGETLVKSLVESVKAPIEAYKVNQISDPKELADYFDDKRNREPDVKESVPSSGLAGTAAGIIGGLPKLAGLLAIPYAGHGLMVAEAYGTSLAAKTEELYNKGLEENLHRGMDESEARIDAARRAKESAGLEAIPDAVIAHELGRSTATSNLTTPAITSFKSALGKYVKGGAKMFAIGGAGGAAEKGVEAANGYKVNVEDVVKGALEKGTDFAVMHLMLDVANPLTAIGKSAPKSLVAMAKEGIRSAPPEIVDAVTEGSPEVRDGLNSYEAARAKVVNDIPEKALPHIAGLVEKQDRINKEIEELKNKNMTLHPALQGEIKEEIKHLQVQTKAIDEQIAKMAKSDDPIVHEVDQVTGERQVDLKHQDEIQSKKEEDAIQVTSPEPLGTHEGGNEKVGGQESTEGVGAVNGLQEPTGPRLEEIKVEGQNNEDVQTEEVKPIGDFTSTNGHKIVNEDGQIKVISGKGKNIGKEVSAKTKRDVIREAASQYDFTQGKEASVPEVAPASQAEHLRHVTEKSNSPVELAEVFLNEEPTTKNLSTKEQMIADYGMGKVKEESYRQFADKNSQNNAKSRAYFSSEGQSIDSLAKEMSDHYGVEISPEDVTNFIDHFPNGADAATATRESDIALAAKDRFSQLTGLPLTDEIAELAIRQRDIKEADQFAKDIPDDVAKIINEEGITADNLEKVKHLFDGFPYTEEDLAAVREHLNSKSEGRSTETAPASEGGSEGEAASTKKRYEELKNPSVALSENEFDRKYKAQHKDLRGAGENAEKNFASMQEQGFKEGIGANALPIQRGENNSIIGRRYGNKKGDVVYLIPKDFVKNTPNGLKVKEGYKPSKEERVTIEYDGQPTYEAYKKQLEKDSSTSESAKTTRYYEEIAGAKPTVTGRIPVDPIIGGSPKNISKIIRDVTQGLSQKLLFARPGRRRALGTYAPGSTGIKIRFNGDLDVTAHELGHSLDDQFSIISELKTSSNPLVESELSTFSPFGSAPPKGHPDPKMYTFGEGFAEWLRARVVNPKEAIKQAPELNKIYEAKVPEKVKKVIEDFSTDFRTWRGASARDITLSNIEWKPEEAKGLIKKLFEKKPNEEMFHISFADKLAANFVNPMHAFEKAWDYAKGITGTKDVIPENDPTILSRLLLSVDSKAGEFLNYGLRDVRDKPILDDNGKPKNFKWLLEPLDNTDQATVEREMKDTVAYMVAERTAELSLKFDRDEVLTGIGGGVFKDVDVAVQTLNEFKTGDKGRLARIQEAAERYRSFSDHILQYMVDKGRMSQEQYDAIKDNNVQYVALKRVFETEPGQEIVMFKGSGGKKLGSIAEPVKKIKGSTKELVNPYISLMDTMFKSIHEADRNDVMRAFRDVLVSDRGMYEGKPEKIAEVGIKGADGDKNTVTIFVDGKPEKWLFQKDVYEALKGLDNQAVNVPKYLTLHAKVLRSTVTKFPIFALRNVIRDTPDRIIKSTDGSGFRDFIGDKEHWHDIARNGGLNAGHYVKSKEHYYGLMTEAINEVAKKKNTIFADGDVLKKAWKGYEDILGKSETANRVAEYRGALRNAKSKGLDDYNASLYAAFKARDFMDFALMGHWMKYINQVVPFTNAAVQGLRSTYKSAKTNPLAFASRVVAYTVIPQVTLWAWNHRDKETSDEYEEMPDYQKDMFWNIKAGKNKWLSIPKPYELGLFAASVDRTLSKTFGHNDKAFDGLAGETYKTLSPIDGTTLLGSFSPEVELMFNKNLFTGRPIIPDYEQPLDLSLRNTGNASRLGSAVEKVAGVDGRKVDFWIKSHFSYVGDLALKASNIGDDTKQNFDATTTGLIKRTPAYNSKSVQDMLEFASKWDLSKSSYVKRIKGLTRDYFSTKDDGEKENVAKEMIKLSKEALEQWEPLQKQGKLKAQVKSEKRKAESLEK